MNCTIQEVTSVYILVHIHGGVCYKSIFLLTLVNDLLFDPPSYKQRPKSENRIICAGEQKMRVPLQIISFSCILFSVTFVQCQECRREDIKYENAELVAKASYAEGETVIVNCMTGYIGLYKLKCEKGEWKKSIQRPCAKKKCSHPGDTPNGDFILTEGTEFVFGATVVYTCKKGYNMTSEINYRTCAAQGWNNNVPVCEAVRCPVIHTDGNVNASGNTEEGRYGDVIHFECVSSHENIDGSSDIHCKETGEWSDAVPKCKDITCTAPVIPNGYVDEPLQEYQKDAILKYRCNPGFKEREGIPRCAKFGWTLNPECDAVTCELISTTFGVKKINPNGKTIFRAGESVEITCSEKYWFIFTKETSRSFTCKDTGEWDHTPVCEEIRCEVPRDQHVYRPYEYFRGDMKPGTKQYYYCESGYDKMAEEATCTRDGWTPNPLCAVMTVSAKCGPPPRVNNADTVEMIKKEYNRGERVEYSCFNKYILDQRHPFTKYLTCQQGQWTGNVKCLKPCTVTKELMAERGINLAYDNKQKMFAVHNDHITFACLRGKKPVVITDFRKKCDDGEMALPACV